MSKFKCNGCGYQFRDNHNLKKHKDRKYPCSPQDKLEIDYNLEIKELKLKIEELKLKIDNYISIIDNLKTENQCILAHLDEHKKLKQKSKDTNFCLGCKLCWKHIEISGKCVFCHNLDYNFRKEIIVKMAFESFGEHFDQHNKTLEISKVRPDLLNFKNRNSAICVSVDENQHSHETEFDRNFRMYKITSALEKTTYFIRFNPDRFNFMGKNKDVPFEDRFNVLYSVYSILKNQVIKDANSPCFVVYLFYDNFDINNLKIFKVDHGKLNFYSNIEIPEEWLFNDKCMSYFKKYCLKKMNT